MPKSTFEPHPSVAPYQAPAKVNPELTVTLTEDQWNIVMGCVMACAPIGGGSVYKYIADSISTQTSLPVLQSKVIWATLAVVNGGIEVEAVAWVGSSEDQLNGAYNDALIEESF